MPILSESVEKVVRNVINVSLEKKEVIELKGTDPLILSHSDVLLVNIIELSDRVNFFWFENRLFIEFFKTHSGTASPMLGQGLDWYSKELRVKLGVDTLL